MCDKRLYVTCRGQCDGLSSLSELESQSAVISMTVESWSIHQPPTQGLSSEHVPALCFPHLQWMSRARAHWDNKIDILSFQLALNSRHHSYLLLPKDEWTYYKQPLIGCTWVTQFCHNLWRSRTSLVTLLPCDSNGTVWLHCAPSQIFTDCFLCIRKTTFWALDRGTVLWNSKLI